jgi:hypothetical protein
VPFEDLNEALAELGHAREASWKQLLSDGLSIRGGGVRAKKKRTGKPRGRPRGVDATKRRATNARARKAWLERKRSRVLEARNEEMAKEDRVVKNVRRQNLETQAKLICVGRAVYSDDFVPDVKAMLIGKDHHETEARTDFWYWLRGQGWDSERIAQLFEQRFSREMVERALAARTARSG